MYYAQCVRNIPIEKNIVFVNIIILCTAILYTFRAELETKILQNWNLTSIAGQKCFIFLLFKNNQKVTHKYNLLSLMCYIIMYQVMFLFWKCTQCTLGVELLIFTWNAVQRFFFLLSSKNYYLLNAASSTKIVRIRWWKRTWLCR